MRKGFKITIGVLAALTVVLAYGYSQTFALRVTRDDIDSGQVPKEFIGTKVVFAADLHCGTFFGQKRVESVVQKINSLNPDIIILGGDYIESGPDYIKPCFGALGGLTARSGIYAVMGNRDYRNGVAVAVRQAMADHNIKLLENSGVWISQNKPGEESTVGRIRLGGIADVLRSNPNIEGALGEVSPEEFAIMVTHNPSFKLITDTRVDLALAGHTHGGQVTLFGLSLLPWQWGWKYTSGLQITDRTTVIVSNGVGTRLLPIRLFAPAEINLITLN